MKMFIVPSSMPPGASLRTMIHTPLEGGGSHPYGIEEIINPTDATLGAGSIVNCAPLPDGRWSIQVTYLTVDEPNIVDTPLPDPDSD